MIPYVPLQSYPLFFPSSSDNAKPGYAFYRVPSESEALRILNRAYEKLTGKSNFWKKFVLNEKTQEKYACYEKKIMSSVEKKVGFLKTKTIYKENLEEVLDYNISIGNYKEYTLLALINDDFTLWRIALDDYISRELKRKKK